MRAYGTWGPKILYGRAFDGVIRSTFVIDARGRIEHALYNVKATGHVARVRKQSSIRSTNVGPLAGARSGQ